MVSHHKYYTSIVILNYYVTFNSSTNNLICKQHN